MFEACLDGFEAGLRWLRLVLRSLLKLVLWLVLRGLRQV